MPLLHPLEQTTLYEMLVSLSIGARRPGLTQNWLAFITPQPPQPRPPIPQHAEDNAQVELGLCGRDEAGQYKHGTDAGKSPGNYWICLGQKETEWRSTGVSTAGPRVSVGRPVAQSLGRPVAQLYYNHG